MKKFTLLLFVIFTAFIGCSKEYFILSLPINQTITYSWDIVNLNNLNIIKFEHKSKIHLNDKLLSP